MAIVDTEEMFNTETASEAIGITHGRICQILRELQSKSRGFKIGEVLRDDDGTKVGIRRGARFWELYPGWVEKQRKSTARDGTKRGRPRSNEAQREKPPIKRRRAG